jgi:hypothetical protein
MGTSQAECDRFDLFYVSPMVVELTAVTSIRRLEPFDPARPCDFSILYDTPSGSKTNVFTVDTEVSSL